MWPLLTVETEANEDLLSTNVRESSMFVLLARRASTRDFYPALAALVSPAQNIFFLTAHFFNICVPIAHQPGQAVGPGLLSLNMCLWC